MANTILNQPSAVSLQLTDYALLWQGGQSPSTRKMPISNLATYYLALTGGTVTGDITFSAAKPKVKGNAGTVRAAQFLTGSTVRWQIDANATAESGTNAGSDFELWSYTDAGAQLTKVLAITRSSGASVFSGAVSGASFIPTSSTVPTNGLFLPAANTIGFSVNSVEKIRLLSTGDIWFTGIAAGSNPIVANSVGMGYSQSTQTLSIYSGTCPLNLAGTFNTQPVTQYLFNQTQVGSVNVTPTTTTYNTTSDARLKIDDGLIEVCDAGRIIDRLRPRWFRFKAYPDADKQPGFFAQQVHRAFPWAVTKGRKGQPWQMDAGKLMPIVITELQALRRRVAELERGV